MAERQASPAVTVLTAVRNGTQFLAATIDSIRAQTIEDWEYVIVDDASTDNTRDIVEGYARTDPRIRLVTRTSAGGPYAAANSGLDSARGTYVARIDADDLALPDRLEHQLEFLRLNSGLRACLGGWREVDEQGRPHGPARQVHTRSAGVLRWSLCVVAGVVHSTLLIERRAMEEVGGYAELPTSADLRLWCQLSRLGWVGVTPAVLVAYRRHASQISTAQHDVQQHWSGQVLKEHLEALDPNPWDLQDVRALRATGRWERVEFRLGLAMLDRWERAWRSDGDLDASDRRELRRLATRVRLRHLRQNGAGLADYVRGGLSLAPIGRSSIRTTASP